MYVLTGGRLLSAGVRDGRDAQIVLGHGSDHNWCSTGG